MCQLGARKILIALIAAAFCVAACSAVGEVVNPYKSRFNCPVGENGKCQTMSSAYNESREVLYGNNQLASVDDSAANAYQNSVYKKLSSLVEEPDMPVIAPPKVMRVLLLPYQDSNKNLFMYRFAYFVVDDYSWVLGNDNLVGEE